MGVGLFGGEDVVLVGVDDVLVFFDRFEDAARGDPQLGRCPVDREEEELGLARAALLEGEPVGEVVHRTGDDAGVVGADPPVVEGGGGAAELGLRRCWGCRC